MKGANRAFDEMGKLASGALGLATGLREEILATVRAQMEIIATRLDLATRSELEELRAMVQTLREEQETHKKMHAESKTEPAAHRRAKASRVAAPSRDIPRKKDSKTSEKRNASVTRKTRKASKRV